jgi:hypothetical protein
MDELKKGAREGEVAAKEAWLKRDGEDLADKVGNLGDEIRKDLGNLGDDVRGAARDAERGADRTAADAERNRY